MSDLVYPGSLEEIWKWWHDPDRSNAETAEEWKLLQALEARMKSQCKNSLFKDDAVHNALYDLFVELSLEDIGFFKSEYFLARRIRRDIAIDQNPEGYDVERKLRKAIRKLIKENKVQSLDLNLKEIEKMSKFKSVSAPDVMAPYSNYELNKSEIPFYKMKPRKVKKEVSTDADSQPDADSAAVKRKKRKIVSLVSPSNAKDLVERLLNLFNGWVEFQVIRKAAWNHIPHSILVEGDENIETKEDEKSSKNDGAVFQPIWDEKALSDLYIRTIKNKCEELWTEICKKTKEDFFCLYILPENAGGKPVGNLEDYGNDSTMFGQKKQVLSILKEQTTLLFKHIRQQSYFFFMKEDDMSMQTVKDILSFLNHRCKEIGYDPHIRMDDDKQYNPKMIH